MIRKHLLLTVFLLLGISQLNAQDIKGNVEEHASQKAGASKGKAGSSIVNVDEYTGTASVRIPIYDYSVCGLNLGVSLAYTAKGIRVDELATSVGLGWNLVAGGSVVREAYGLEDEITLPTHYRSDWADSIEGYLVPGAKHPNTGIYGDDDDREKDLFHFNLVNRSVDVVFDYDGSGNLIYQTYPKSDIKINVFTEDIDANGNYTNTRSGVQRRIGPAKNTNVLTFQVIDERGNTYDFKRGDCQAKDFGFPYLGDTAVSPFIPDSGIYYVTTKWVLTKLTTYTRVEINYAYTSASFDYVENVTETLYPRDEWDGPRFNDPLKIEEQRWTGTKSYLTSISYPDNSKLLFTTDSVRCDCKSDFVLKSIRLQDKYDDNIENSVDYTFKYAYFNTSDSLGYHKKEVPYNGSACALVQANFTYSTNDQIEKHQNLGLRLELKGVKRLRVINSTTYEEPYYDFEYDTTYALPYRFSAHKDYYGFYNGKTAIPYVRTNFDPNGPGTGVQTYYLSIPIHDDSNYYSDPNILVYNDPWGLDRSYDFSYAKAFTLTKIKTCGGGQTELQYQDYMVYNPSNSYGCIDYGLGGCSSAIDAALQGDNVNDGLCIWKIINSDAYSSQTGSTTEYTFENGERFHRGGYCWYSETVAEEKTWTNYFVGANNYFNGSNHGFGKVTVVETGFNNEQMSKSIHWYSNLMYGGVSAIRKPTGLLWHTMPADMKKYKMGLPLSVENYNENNMEISSTEYLYEYVDLWTNVTNMKTFQSASWQYHLLDYEEMRVDSIIKKTYNYDPVAQSTTHSIDVTSYAYDDKDNVKMKVNVDSKGDYFKTYYKYNYDYYNTYSTNTSLANMDALSMQFRLSDETWKMAGSDSVLLGYNLIAPVLGTGHLSFPASFNARLQNPLASASVGTSTLNKGSALDFLNHTSYGSNLVKTRQVLQYDGKNNPLEIKQEGNQNFKSYVWEYRTGKLLAEVANAHYDEIAYTSFENGQNYLNDPATSMGNWDFDPENVAFYSDVSLNNAMTGSYVYAVSNGVQPLQSQTLAEGKYMLSFWTTGDVDPAVQMGASYLNIELQNTVGIWKLYTAAFEVQSPVTILFEPPVPPIQGPAPTYFLDEVRLHPADAFMTSYTYVPLWGVGTVNDPGNRIQYYEYGPLGRKVTIRDLRGKILSKKETVCNEDISTDQQGGESGGGSSGGGGNG